MMNMEEVTNTISSMMLLLTIYVFVKNHVMSNLIIIEYIIICLILMLFIMLTAMKMENFIMMFFLVMVISESIMGLSILISMVRTHGNDYVKSLSMMKL